MPLGEKNKEESTQEPGKKFKKFLRGMSVHQKLGVNLESKVIQKLSLDKKVFTKKQFPKLISLDKIFFLEKFD